MTLDTWRNACFEYQMAYVTFPAEISQLVPPQGGNFTSKDAADLIGSNMIPSRGAALSKDGYTFRYVPGPANAKGVIETYSMLADPVSYNNSGKKRYFTDQSTVIHFTLDGTEPSTSSPVM